MTENSTSITEKNTDNVSKKQNEQKPTIEQTLAKSIDRHISVTANAGSGKTSVLVDRYYKIITEGDKANNIPPVEPRDIKAITFTNKAAAEMKERLVRKIAEEAQATTDSARLEFLNELRVKLSNADISTIHSFCGTLLRTFPIEAGVSPNFRECTEADTFVIRKQVIGSVIDDILYEIGQSEDSDPIDIDEFKELIYAVGGLGRLSVFLSRIISNRMIFDKAKHLYELSFEEYVQKYYESVEVILRKLLEKVRDSLQLVLDKGRFLDSEKHSAWRGNINTAINIAEGYLSGMQTMGSEFVIDQIAKIATNIDNALKENKLFTKEWKMGARTLKSIIEEEDKDLIPQVENTLLTFNKLDKTVGNSEIDFKQFKYSKLLSKLAEKAIAKYDAELLQNDMLDFDNLILKANKLLTEYHDRGLVANTLRDKIKFLMVDEFQDTDSVQYGIIREIIRNIGNSYAGSSNINNNLFIVGDPKQSIYGFRGADVSVFNTAKEEIKVANKDASDEFIVDGEEIEAIDNEAKGEIILKSTFRNTPDIAFFVNDVCNPMFRLELSIFSYSDEEAITESSIAKEFCKYGVKYEDLVTALIAAKLDKTQLRIMAQHLESRQYSKEEITDIINNLEDTGKGDDIFGGITLLNYVVPKEIVKLLKLSGKEINDLHHYDYLIDYILKLKEEKGVDFKDFAVVSRTKPLLEELSLKLIERGVPFINNSSKGFYGIPEVQSIISLLKFISNYNDDVAFMSVLRSSFCGFDNTDLYFLSMVYKSKDSGNINFSSLPMFQKMEVLINTNYIPENEEVRRRLDKYKATHKILRELIDTKLDLEPAIMLRKAFELFNWYNVISNSPYRERIKTNADKIVQMAREYVRQGFKNIYDFVNELEYLSENELTESEAVLQSSADQISLLTVHAAKGTEYKYLVYLSGDKATNTNNRDGIYIDDYFGISFPFKMLSKEKKQVNDKTYVFSIQADKPEVSNDEESVKSTIYSLSNDKYVIKTKEEEKRIFYVGLTRAKKGLIIFSKLNYTTKSKVGIITLKPYSLFGYMRNSIQVYDDSKKEEEKFIKLDKYIENKVDQCIRAYNSEVAPHVLDYRPIIIDDDLNEVESEAKRNLLLIAGKEHINCTLNDHIQKIKLGIYVYAVNNNANKPERINLNNESDGNNIEEMTQILTSNISGKFISATEMKLYANDKDKYQVKYLLGLHEDDKKHHYTKSEEEAEEIELFTAMDFGTATHKVFEYIKKWYKAGAIDEIALDETLDIVMSSYYLLKEDELNEKRSEIKSIVRDVIATGYIAKYEQNIEDSMAEYTILHTLSENILQGQLDMLIKNSKGEYEVWDWKTDKLHGNIDRLAENYAAQMKQYAYLLSQMYPGQTEYIARLLFVRGAKNAVSDADWVRTHTIKREDIPAYEQETKQNIQGINAHPFFNHIDE